MANLVHRGRVGTTLAKRAKQHDRGPRVEYLAFRLADELYAAQISLIREILKPPPLTPVPRAPSSVLGIISVRGQLVTVIDLRRKLHLPEAPETGRSRILLVDATGGERLGLYVDEVLQVYRLSSAEIEQTAAALGGEVANYIAGIARPNQPHVPRETVTGEAEALDASVVILLDLRVVLAS